MFESLSSSFGWLLLLVQGKSKAIFCDDKEGFMKPILFFLLMLFVIPGLHAVNITSAVAAYDMTLNGGNLLDITGKNHTSSGLGGATIVSSTYGSALSFDGSDQVRINDAADLRLGNQITLEASFTITSLASDWVRVVGKGQPGPRNYGLWYNPVYNYFLFQMYSASGNVDVLLTQTIQLNQWYHMAGTYDGSVARLYLNGVQVATQSVVITPYTSSDPLTIGGADFHTLHRGLIDNVAIFNTVLSASELANQAAHFSVPEPASLLSLLLVITGFGIVRYRK